LHIRLTCFGVALAALSTLALPALADDSYFDPGKAQAALEKIFDKAGNPSKILNLEIRTGELEIDVAEPAQPKNIDAWTASPVTTSILRWIYPESISGPRAVDPALPNPDLAANLFEFKPSDAAVLPKLIAAAIAHAALEDTATVARMELRRQLHLVPEASSGPPEWDIEVTSGRERATIYADLAGRITRANFDGTRRAQSLNYLAGGKDLDDVVAMIADALGRGEVVKSVIVYNHNLVFDARNTDHPERFARYGAGLNGVYRDLLLDPVANMPTANPNGAAPGLFGITDVDWSLLPKLEQAARDRLQLPGGKIALVTVSKPTEGVGGAQIEWELNVEAADDRSIEGYVTFDANGNVLRTRYPPAKEPPVNLFDGTGYATTFAALTKGLGDHAAMVELMFSADQLLLTTRDPQMPAALVVFEYRGESLARSIMTALDWPTFGPDWFFDLAQVQPLGARWADMQRDTLARLGLAEGKIERITISKQKMFMPRNDRVLIEVRASIGNRQGWVVYDLSGKAVDMTPP
jgi:hypothetical protein